MKKTTAKRLAGLVASAFLLQACGQEPQAGSSASSMRVRQELEFQDWCARWTLRCPSGAPANVPSPTTPWSSQQWKSVMASLKALASSPSSFEVTRSQLDDDSFGAVVGLLGGEELIAHFKQRLDAIDFDSLKLANGGLALKSRSASDFRTGSGLVVQSSTQVTASVNAQLDLIVGGVRLSNGSTSQVLERLSFPAQNVMQWRGPQVSVKSVPIRFLLEELWGMRIGGASDNEKISYERIVSALIPMRNWLLGGSRDLDLHQTSFDQLAQHVPSLIGDPTIARSTRSLLGQISRVQSTAASRNQKLLQGTAKGEITCNVAGKAQITIEPNFGIQSLEQLGSNGGAKLRLYGIRARPLSGIVRPTIRLGRIDLQPKRIVIYDVPVIGTYEIDMTKPDEDTPFALNCGNGR